MTQEEVEQSVLGRGAKLAGILVVVAAAFAMGLSRHNVSQNSNGQDELNQALFHQMMDHHQTAMNNGATASAGRDEVASTETDPAAAPDGQ